MSQIREGALVLSDGATFEGELIGAEVDVTSGEVVFNTVLSGYQEVITDPSYAGQIINFTYPHIGNYGVSNADVEARRPFCRGIVVRDLARRRSNWRSEGDLESYLMAEGIPGIAGIDTRRLTRHVRENGAMPAAFGSASLDLLVEAAASDSHVCARLRVLPTAALPLDDVPRCHLGATQLPGPQWSIHPPN